MGGAQDAGARLDSSLRERRRAAGLAQRSGLSYPTGTWPPAGSSSSAGWACTRAPAPTPTPPPWPASPCGKPPGTWTLCMARAC